MHARTLPLAVLVTLALALSLLAPAAAPRPAVAQGSGSTSLISYAPGRLPPWNTYPWTYASAWSAGFPAISADGGRIAFATNLSLVVTDTNGISDIYLYDRATRRQILASPVYSLTVAAGIDSMTTADLVRISPNGRYITFASSSSRLAEGDTNGHSDVFLFEIPPENNPSLVGRLHMVSSPTSDGDSLIADVSNTGVVAFVSKDSGLVPNDTNGVADIFVRDMATGAVERVSVASDGAQATGSSAVPAISADGNWVVFTSFADNLLGPGGDTNNSADIFLYSRADHSTVRVSVASSGAAGNQDSRLPDIAVNGDELRVIFQSSADKLVADDTNSVDDVFLYTRSISAGTHTTSRVSVGDGGVEGDKPAGGPSIYYWPSISSDGKFVVFPSSASTLVPGDTNNLSDLFIHNIVAGTTARVSLGNDGAQPGSSFGAAADGGRLVAFSGSGSLSPMSARMGSAIFLRDRQGVFAPPAAPLASLAPASLVRLAQNRLTLQGDPADPPADQPVGYAWLSSRDGVIAQDIGASIPATQLSVGAHEIRFVVIDAEGEAAASAPMQLQVIAPGDQGIETLILTNLTRMRQLYPGAAVDSLAALLPTLAAHPAVRGQVLDVSADAATAEAYSAWVAAPTTANANRVVERIKAQIDAFWAGHSGLRYLVIAGDDRVIPFRRLPDELPRVMQANEYEWPEEVDYANTVQLSAATTTGSALRDNQILTDDYYGYNTARYRQGVEPAPRYYVPELGTGRLVESPAQIQAQIHTFLQASSVTVSRAAVTAWGLDTEGHDMLGDSGLLMSAALAGDGIETDAGLVGAPVSADSFRARLLASGARNEILAFSHHANHAGFDPGSGMVWFDAFDTAGADLARALLYSAGCHIGLNVPADNPPYIDDMAEHIAAGRSANYLGSTGFGIACSGCIGWTEQLLGYFTDAITAGTIASPGDALATAKAEYQRATFYATYGLGDQEADAKASLQLVLYGLPMYSYVTPGGAAPAADDGVVVTMSRKALGGGLTVNGFAYQFPPLDEVVTSSGRYYTLQGSALAGQSQPLQPRYSADLTFPGTQAHGVVFRGGSYTTLASFDPVVAAMVNEYVAAAEPGVSGASWRPALPARINSLGGVSTVVAALGQYQPSTQAERIFQRLALDIYYYPESTDWEAPQITSLYSAAAGAMANVTVTASDPAGIAAVIVAYTRGDGAWESVALVESAAGWAGSIPAGKSTRLFVQAVDGVGNVAALNNDGEYYLVGAAVDAPLRLVLPLVRR